MGSFDKVTNESGAVVDRYSFDAWGNRRNYDNWQLPDNSTHLFSRGYTGHSLSRISIGKHLDKFGLINMLSVVKSREQSDSGNGRLYDSKLARFLSPDPVLQDPSNTQNYNRYSYCLNNPFAYTDPSGYVYGGAGSNYTPGGTMPYYNNPGLSNFKTGSFHSSWESDWQDNINNGSINTENICHLTGNGWNIRGSSFGTWSKQYIDLGGLGKIPYYTNSYSGAIRTGFRFTTISNESITYEWKGNTETYSSTCVGVGWAWLTIMPHYGRNDKQLGNADLKGIGLAILGFGFSVGERIKTDDSWFCLKQMKTYKNSFYGNQYTIKQSSAAKISPYFKWAGRLLGAYNSNLIHERYKSGEINSNRMIYEQSSNLFSTFGGLYGAAWGIGTSLGDEFGPMNGEYWKRNH